MGAVKEYYYDPINIVAREALKWAYAGPLWVSAGGGTANVLAGEIAHFMGCPFIEALKALREVGGQHWYSDLYFAVHVSDGPCRDARGVGRYLERLDRKGYFNDVANW